MPLEVRLRLAAWELLLGLGAAELDLVQQASAQPLGEVVEQMEVELFRHPPRPHQVPPAMVDQTTGATV